MGEHSIQTTSLIRGWFFRIFLLVGVIACGFGFAESFDDYWDFKHNTINATILNASARQSAPTLWSSDQDEDHPRAKFMVKVTSVNNPATTRELYLQKPTIEALLRNEPQTIKYVKDRPARHFLETDRRPALRWWAIPVGLIFLALFVLSMRLR